MSQQLARPWMGFVSPFDNASHSPSSCLVFQRVSPRESVSSSLPTLGRAQECDTLPDKQTHRLSGCTCCQRPDKWRAGGVLSDAFSYFLWFDWGAWAPLGGHKSINHTRRVFYVSSILCEMFSFHILYDTAVQLVPQELNMNRIARIKTQSSSTCAGWFITFFFLKESWTWKDKEKKLEDNFMLHECLYFLWHCGYCSAGVQKILFFPFFWVNNAYNLQPELLKMRTGVSESFLSGDFLLTSLIMVLFPH